MTTSRPEKSLVEGRDAPIDRLEIGIDMHLMSRWEEEEVVDAGYCDDWNRKMSSND